MAKDKIVLVGGGGHCTSCIDVLEVHGEFEILGIVDTKEKVGSSLLGYPYIGIDDDLAEIAKQTRYFLLTVGQIKSSETRRRLVNKLEDLGALFPTIISPLAHVSKHAKIAEGTIVMHQAIVNANAKIGKFNILNTKCLLEHDSSTGDFCHISTGAIVNGSTQIGEDSFIGSQAVIFDQKIVPPESIVHAGTFFK